MTGRNAIDEMTAKWYPHKSVDGLAEYLAELDVGRFLYYVAFLLFSLGHMTVSYSSIYYVGYESLQTACTGLKLIAMVMLVLKITLFQRYDFSKLIISMGICLLGLLTYRTTGSLAFLYLCIFVVAAKDVEIRPIASLALFSSIFVICFCFVGYFADLLPDLHFIRAETIQIRHTYGFCHPNALGLMVSEMCVCVMVLRFNKIGLPEAMLCIASIILIGNTSDSRTSMVSIALAYILFFCAAHLHSGISNRVFGVGLILVVAVIVLLSFWFMTNYDSSRPIDLFFNDLVDDRPRRANWYFMNCPPGLFGQDTSLLPVLYSNDGTLGDSFMVDNAYSALYLHYGPIAFCVTVLSLAWFLVTSCKRRKLGIVFVGLVFASLYGFSESYFMNIEFNYFLIGLSWALYGFPESS